MTAVKQKEYIKRDITEKLLYLVPSNVRPIYRLTMYCQILEGSKVVQHLRSPYGPSLLWSSRSGVVAVVVFVPMATIMNYQQTGSTENAHAVSE